MILATLLRDRVRQDMAVIPMGARVASCEAVMIGRRVTVASQTFSTKKFLLAAS